MPSVRQLVDDLQDVGAEPRLGCAPGALPGHAPVVETDRRGDELGSGADLRRVRVAGGEDPLRKGVRREQHARLSRQGRQLGAEIGGDELDEGRFGRPAFDRAHDDAVWRGSGGEPGRGTGRWRTPSSAAPAPTRRPRGTRSAANASTACSMNGAACLRPSTTWYRPSAALSRAACSASRCASVRWANGEMPPIASYRAVRLASCSGDGGLPRRMSV